MSKCKNTRFASSAVNGRVVVVCFHCLFLTIVLEFVAFDTGVVRWMIMPRRSFFIMASSKVQVTTALESVIVMTATKSERFKIDTL